MNSFLNQLNLTPQERRIVVIIFLVVIVVLNFLFVWPHFSEWSSINKQLNDTRAQILKEVEAISKDVDPTNGVRKQVDKLARKEQKQGAIALSSTKDPQLQLNDSIRIQKEKTGVFIGENKPGAINTNDPFFTEYSTTVTYESQEAQLVNFLYNMGNDPAMIRVANLDLHPADANRYKLKGYITLKATYEKKQAPPGPAAAPAKTPAKTPAETKAAAAAKKAEPPTAKPPPAPAKPAPKAPPAVVAPDRHHAPAGPPSPGPAKPLPGGLKPPPGRMRPPTPQS